MEVMFNQLLQQMSNSSVALIHDLYSEYIIDVVPAKRAINCKGNRRGPVNEVLIRNYSIPRILPRQIKG